MFIALGRQRSLYHAFVATESLASDSSRQTPAKGDSLGGREFYGGAGVCIFFAYIGFDAVSTAAQEAKNPKKDMPLGILGSLVICTVLYILVSGLLTRLVPYTRTQRSRSGCCGHACRPDSNGLRSWWNSVRSPVWPP